MEKRTSAFARIFAALAIAAALVAVFAIATGSLDEDSSKNGKHPSQHAKTEREKPKITAKTYEVEEGDTLTRISHLTGVKVTRLIELNPETDPQGLVIGEVLKLR